MHSDVVARLIIDYGEDCDYYAGIPQLTEKLSKLLESRQHDILDLIFLCVEHLSFKIEAYSHLLKSLISSQNDLLEATIAHLLRSLNQNLDNRRFYQFSAVVC